MAVLTASEYAKANDISVQTVKRRLKSGDLKGYQKEDGLKEWVVEVDTDDISDISVLRDRLERAESLNEYLKGLVDKKESEFGALIFELGEMRKALSAAPAPEPLKPIPWYKRLLFQ